jgi:hypothetical protein
VVLDTINENNSHSAFEVWKNNGIAVGGCNYDLLEDMLQVVMKPSSVRLAKLWLCLWWGCIRDQRWHQDTALGHLLVVLPGNVSLGVWIGMTNWDWRLSSDKGQWRFTTEASHVAV